MNTSLIDYAKCHDYARTLCGSYGIPECDCADIGSDAYLLAIRRSWRAADGDNEQAVANRLMYTSTVDIIRKRNKRSFRILSDAEDLYRSNDSDGAPTDDEAVEERFAASDRGSTEESLTDYLDWQNPFWLRLFNLERQKLRNKKRKHELRLIREGLKDSRLSFVWEKMHISWGVFQTVLGNLKVRFDLCFRALRAWRG